ncbi:dCTP deaminase domain-containing protein [Staphylococcus equorum]|uniref:dUTP diphosphatase n=1 Tax=Staphylococcus equorum TaxID=246432 RepID=A0A9X4LAP2_9STAP|nr:dUTPase [Staphylococcus equorum]MDG0860356.1 dUTPase [Staphylococcus equorum]
MEYYQVRGFEEVSSDYKKHDSKTIIPTRSDNKSAGYDFHSKELIEIQPGEQHLIWTDIKVYMLPSEVLTIHIRSSVGIKTGLQLANTTGIIDSSYYGNGSNDGNIGICLKNTSEFPVVIQEGDRIAQGIFSRYLTTDNDSPISSTRSGGIGSSGK